MDGSARPPFGTTLRRLRLAAGLTQEALAERAGMSQRGIQSLEAGVRRPYPDTLERLSQALGLAGDARARFEAAGRAPLRVGGSDEARPPEATRPHNLSAPLASFIGREREVADVRGLLGAHRLVTLTGPGGVGKTRLALRAVAEALDGFADGACFVSLAPIADVDLVLPALAQALGVRETPGRSLLKTLAGVLRAKHLLLVLDNFEQVLPAGPHLAQILGTCPRLSVLVTSRALLRLQGEQAFAVPPLTLPGRQQGGLVEDLTRYEAVRLFLERAQAVKPEFTLSEQNAPAVVEICQRLDGLPLAIELAAARVRLFPPRTLLAQLQQRLPMLTGGARDLPARQRTLRDAIAWSYDLLQPGEQLLFRRLGVFVGGSTVEAVVAVMTGIGSKEPELGALAAGISALEGEWSWPDGQGPDGPSSRAPSAPIPNSILDGLAALVDQNLLRQEEQDDGEVRLLMLETIREYALEQLTARAEAESARRAHAAYYLAMAEQAHAARAGPRQGDWLDRLECDEDNLRAALAWTTTEAGDDTGPRLAAALWPFWARRGNGTEGRNWLAKVLMATQATGPSGVGKTSRAKALQAAGTLELAQGDYVAARALRGSPGLAPRPGRCLGDRRGAEWAGVGAADARRARSRDRTGGAEPGPIRPARRHTAHLPRDPRSWISGAGPG